MGTWEAKNGFLPVLSMCRCEYCFIYKRAYCLIGSTYDSFVSLLCIGHEKGVSLSHHACTHV